MIENKDANSILVESKEFQSVPRTLEIGVGSRPYYEILVAERPKGFVGVDLQERELTVLKRQNSEVDVAATNARLLPFTDSSFDNIILNSVIGGPDEEFYKGQKPATSDEEFLAKKYAIIKEALRVLKPGGRIKFFELYTIVNKLGVIEILHWLRKQKEFLREVKDDPDLQKFITMTSKSKVRDVFGFVFEKIQ